LSGNCERTIPLQWGVLQSSTKLLVTEPFKLSRLQACSKCARAGEVPDNPCRTALPLELKH